MIVERLTTTKYPSEKRVTIFNSRIYHKNNEESQLSLPCIENRCNNMRANRRYKHDFLAVVEFFAHQELTISNLVQSIYQCPFQ